MRIKKGLPKPLALIKTAVEMMNPELKALYEKMIVIDMNLNKNDLMGHHNLGRELNKLFSDSSESTYGTGAVEKVAAAMQRSRSYVDQARRLATYWTGAELEDLIDAYKNAGASLTFTHMRILSGIKDDEQRNLLCDKCTTEVMSTEDLVAEVDRLCSEAASPKSRRPMGPKSPSSGLSQLYHLSTKLLAKKEQYQIRVFGALADVNPKDVDDDLLNHIDKTEKSLEELEHFIHDSVKQLKAAKDTALRISRQKEDIRQRFVEEDSASRPDDEEDDDEDDAYDFTDEEADDELPSKGRLIGKKVAAAH